MKENLFFAARHADLLSTSPPPIFTIPARIQSLRAAGWNTAGKSAGSAIIDCSSKPVDNEGHDCRQASGFKSEKIKRGRGALDV
jgi:hypothetical protein